MYTDKYIHILNTDIYLKGRYEMWDYGLALTKTLSLF